MNVERVMKLVDRCHTLDPSKQCTEYLRIEDERCVEGVACDIYMEETGNGSWLRLGLTRNRNYYGFRSHGNASAHYAYRMPPEVIEWFGFKNAHADRSHYSETLFVRNDGFNKLNGDHLEPQSFAELAAWIKSCISMNCEIYV